MMTEAGKRRVQAILAEKRERFPALRRAPSLRDLGDICRAEQVTIVNDERIPTAGMLVGFAGEWTVFLSKRLAWSLRPPTLLHELAHLWLHHDPYAERHELLFAMLANEDDDPREEEADYFVALVFGDQFIYAPIAQLRPSPSGFELEPFPLQGFAAEGAEGPPVVRQLLEQGVRVDGP